MNSINIEGSGSMAGAAIELAEATNGFGLRDRINNSSPACRVAMGTGCVMIAAVEFIAALTLIYSKSEDNTARNTLIGLIPPSIAISTYGAYLIGSGIRDGREINFQLVTSEILRIINERRG